MRVSNCDSRADAAVEHLLEAARAAERVLTAVQEQCIPTLYEGILEQLRTALAECYTLQEQEAAEEQAQRDCDYDANHTEDFDGEA